MKTLTLDIGNTCSSVGMFCERKLIWRHEFETAFLREKLDEISGKGPDLCVISCVSSKASSLTERIYHLLDCKIVEVQPLHAPLVIHYEHPERLGQDRIANALGARLYSDHGAIVVDMGTATHFDIVNEKGEFCGGPILSGVETMLDALTQRIPHLPNPDLSFELEPVSQSTLSAIRTGTLLCTAGGIERIVFEIKKQISFNPKVILTGGNATLIAPHIVYDEWIPDLTLEGLRVYGELAMGNAVQ